MVDEKNIGDMSPEELGKRILGKLQEFGVDGIAMRISQLETVGTRLNNTLGLTKDRIGEIKAALGDVAPDFAAIGGDVNRVQEVLTDLAMASRRSMVASGDLVTQLFAAQKMLNVDAQSIAETFIEVGVGLEKIPKELANSMSYVRSIGGNANEITKQVLNNMDKINRYQFEGGVMGLTKMAAQASMLRFDMGETFALADKALDPEGAIELSSAFQRLGVSAGNLLDPFQLMQQSLMDPQGLQDSLIQVSKQFVSFNEETKSFKINPQGVMMLREIEKQTGVSAKELSKAGIAARELDARLSQISPRIKFDSEEDKQYLANIAKMGEGGEYIVETKDEGTKKLSEITQTQFDALIEEQKKQPKDLVDVAYKQLQLTEKIVFGIDSLVDNFSFGVASSKVISKEIKGVENIVESTLRNVQKNVSTIQSENIRKETDDALTAARKLLGDLKEGKITEKTFDDVAKGIKTKFGDIISGLKQDMIKVAKEATSQTTGGSAIEGVYNDLIGMLEGGIKAITGAEEKIDASKSIIYGTEPIKGGTDAGTKQQKMSVEFGKLDMNLNLKMPEFLKGFSEMEIRKLLSDTFESNSFKQGVIDTVKSGTPSLKQSK
jgi:hypothetical protein